MNEEENPLQINVPNKPTISQVSPTTTNVPNIENDSTEELTSEPIMSLKSEWIKVSLEPTLMLAQLNDLKEQLQQSFGHRVQLCGDKVERIDTATLQLLLAFVNSQEVTVGWVEPSQELCNVAYLLGLSSLMGLPTTE